jgi:hypothetical protein
MYQTTDGQAVQQPAFDVDAIRAHVRMLYDLAAGKDGLFCLCPFGEDPISGVKKTEPIQHFSTLGDPETLVRAIMSFERHPHVNVYLPLAIMRKNLERGHKGLESDVTDVLGFVLDHDADDRRPSVPLGGATYVVETSATPAPNRQLFYLLDYPISPREAKPLAEALQAACGGDFGTKDLSHVWRIPGCLNWPTKKKVERNRPLEPQPVRIVQPFALERCLSPETLARALAAQPKPAQPPPGASPPPNGHAPASVADLMARLSESLRFLVRAHPEPGTNRSDLAASVFTRLAWEGLSAEEIKRLVEAHPDGVGQRYVQDGKDLDADLDRVLRKFASEPRHGPRREAPQAKSEVDDFLSSGAFVRSFIPPDYVVEGVLVRGYLYSLTARTGHGKTGLLMHLTEMVARGGRLGPHEVEPGHVLYFAGENPEDITMRWIAQADAHGFDAETMPVTFVKGVKPIAENLERWKRQATRLPNLSLVVIDTATAFFPGDDPNNNAQQGAFARLLRAFTEFPGRPAVVVATHPVKSAGSDNLVPQGGGNFLNEVDGNLSLWADDQKQTTLSSQGKFRGPDFNPMNFKLELVRSEQVKDRKGRIMPTVVARPLSDAEEETSNEQRKTDQRALLGVIGMNPGLSVRKLADAAGWFTERGLVNRSKVERMLRTLRQKKYISDDPDEVSLTDKGKRLIGWDRDTD